jgi:formyl-CoA transferase
MTTSSAQPLSGIKVLDLTHAVYGALASQLLGDAGADVIKVEPPWGDFMRLARLAHGKDSSAWLGVNRSKRSLAIDLRREEGQAAVLKIAAACDVLMHNYRPGAMEKLGLGYEDVRKVNPRIIYSVQSAYGENGPLKRWAGGDMWAQAFGGVVSIQGSPGGPPYLGGLAAVDHGGAALSAFAIMVALRARDVTGEGQYLGTSLLESVLFLQAAQVGDYLIDGIELVKGGRGWRGTFTYGAYTAADGDVVIIHGADDAEWPLLTRLLGLEHLLEDERFATREQRVARKEELYPLLDAAFSRKTRREWQQIFHEHRLRCDPCLTYSELFAHPQTQAIDIVLETADPVRGPLKTIGVPYTLQHERPKPERPPPRLGENSVEVLKEFAFDTATIESLLANGIVLPAEE